MQMKFFLLLGLAIALAGVISRTQARIKPAWSQRAKGWQKFFGAIAVVLTMLIILNPEFLALGLLGDAAFFDMLVLALSLQMHTFAARVVRACITLLARVGQRLDIPSLGLRYLLAVSTTAIADATRGVRKLSIV